MGTNPRQYYEQYQKPRQLITKRAKKFPKLTHKYS